MMKSRTGSCTAAAIFLLVFMWVLSLPAAAEAAVPGLDLYNNGLGVCSWTTNNNGQQFTGILHSVWVIDHDNNIGADGSSHIVTVTPPGASLPVRIYPSSSCSQSGCLYELLDTSINQGNLGAYNGTYTYRVEEAGNPSSFSEATDVLIVAPVGMLSESTFSPKHPTAQAITAYFDDVYVNGSLYDDFSSGLDPARWTWDSRWVSAESGQAKFSVDFNPGRGSYYLSLTNPSTVNTLKATVRVSSMTGNLPQARISSTKVRDNVGDIFASVRIRGNEATYTIGPEWYSGNHYRGVYYVSNAVLGTVTTGNRYELSVTWDEPSQTYMFRVKGLNDSVDYSASYTLSGNITPAQSPSSNLGVADWVMTSTTPEFNWTPVEGASHYRIRIYGLNNNTIFRGWATTPPYKLPPGIIKPDSYYKYRIEAIRDHQWFEWDNVSRSDRELTRFGTLSEEAQAPYVDLYSIGAEAFTTGILNPFVSFYVKVYDAQGVPQNIESVTATVPGVGVVNLYLDVNEGANCGIYRGEYYGLPLPAGVYTITATDKDGHTHSAIDTLDPNLINPAPEASLVPIDNTVVNNTAVSFDWADVPGAAAYDLQIYDKNLNRVVLFRTTQSLAYLPPGILKEGTYYRYKIMSHREFYENTYSNGSTSETGSLSDMLSFFTTGTSGGSPPTLTIDKFGVAVWRAPHTTAGSLYNLEFSALVSKPGGMIPESIKAVEVTLPDSKKLALKFTDSATTWGYNYFEDETYTSAVPIQPGTYSFTVTDFDNNTFGPVTEVLTADDIAAAANFGWPTITAPADASILNDTTPQITWTGVTGAAYYRVRILDAYSVSYLIHLSPELTGTSYTMPAGVLQPNRTYRVRVLAFREPIGAEVDAYSGSSSTGQTDVHLIVPDTVTGPNIVITPLDQNTGTTSATITFALVTGTGTTTLASSSSGIPPPGGFALGNAAHLLRNRNHGRIFRRHPGVLQLQRHLLRK